jgi:hypothetical protein
MSLGLCGYLVEKTAARNTRSVLIRHRQGASTLQWTPPHQRRHSARASSSSVPSSPPSAPSSSLKVSGSEREEGAGVDHVVLLKIKGYASKKDIRKMYERVKGLTEINGVKSVIVGESFVKHRWMEDRRDGYTHYIRVRLNSIKALKKYTNHPIHLSVVAEAIRPLLEEPPLAIDCDAPEVVSKEEKPSWKIF